MTSYRLNHERDAGYAVIRRNDTVEATVRGKGFCVRLYTADGSFVRFAGTWRLLRDAVEETKAHGYTSRPIKSL